MYLVNCYICLLLKYIQNKIYIYILLRYSSYSDLQIVRIEFPLGPAILLMPKKHLVTYQTITSVTNI